MVAHSSILGVFWRPAAVARDRKRDGFDIAKPGNHGNYLSLLNRTCPVFRPRETAFALILGRSSGRLCARRH